MPADDVANTTVVTRANFKPETRIFIGHCHK